MSDANEQRASALHGETGIADPCGPAQTRVMTFLGSGAHEPPGRSFMDNN